MTLQWFGQSFFRVETQGKVIAIDPFSPDPWVGIPKPPRFRADLVLVTHAHDDHNNAGAIEGEPLVFCGPGEYETRGIFIEGVSSFHDASSGKERGANTIFVIETEGMRLIHMGDFGEARLSEAQLEKTGGADILLIPVGGTFTIDGKQAAAITNRIEPKVVIPMHFKVGDLKLRIDGPELFLKELGVKPVSEEKLSVRTKDLPQEKTEVHLLRATSFEKQ